jgi:hypothetical protein
MIARIKTRIGGSECAIHCVFAMTTLIGFFAGAGHDTPKRKNQAFGKAIS